MAEEPLAQPSPLNEGQIIAATRADLEDVVEEAATIAVKSMVSERYSGQFPHPDHLERYAALYEDAPRIIFESFKEQGEHRREMEGVYVRGTEKRAAVGQVLGFVLLAAVIGLGVFVSVIGQPIAGTTTVGLALTGGALTYVFGVRHQNDKK